MIKVIVLGYPEQFQNMDFITEQEAFFLLQHSQYFVKRIFFLTESIFQWVYERGILYEKIRFVFTVFFNLANAPFSFLKCRLKHPLL